jgi:hypothetical protein
MLHRCLIFGSGFAFAFRALCFGRMFGLFRAFTALAGLVAFATLTAFAAFPAPATTAASTAAPAASGFAIRALLIRRADFGTRLCFALRR